MDYGTVATLIEFGLGSVSGFSGKTFKYIPNIKTEQEVLDNLTVDGRINAWFINRIGVSAQKYGEAARRIPSRYRGKDHLFQIRGFVSLYEDQSGTPSEIQFQNLCDNIEEWFSTHASLGIADHTVFVQAVRVDVGYEMFAGALCHSATVYLQVSETLATNYQL